MKPLLFQVDLTFSEVDELDRSSLACILGRNPDGTAPVHLPIPRMRQLLSISDHFVALVYDPAKVVTLSTIEARLNSLHAHCAPACLAACHIGKTLCMHAGC